MRLHSVAPSSEFEAQASLHLPTGAPITSPDQRSINQSLDSIAAKSSNPLEALQVEVMAMGDGSDANFPAIYADLFSNRTFDNSDGGWSYDVCNSCGLPDFLG